MNFQKYYFQKEQNLDEGPITDIANSSIGTVGKAVAKGVGRGALNVLKGAVGKTKTIAFEPNWLKVLKPVDIKTYMNTQKTYANWVNMKTKLGPKRTITIKDSKDAVLGDFSGNDFEDILIAHDTENDPTLKNINMDAKIKPKMSVYILNNGGKVLFLNLPLGDDGKKRKFAIGLDNKGERAFRLIHGMPFEDYSLKGTEEGKPEEGKPEEVKKPTLTKMEIKKPDFDKITPKVKINASNDSYDLFDVYNEEVLKEVKKSSGRLEINGKKAVMKDTDGNWYLVSSGKKLLKNNPVSPDDPDKFIAVNSNSQPDENSKTDFEKYIEQKKKDLSGNKEDYGLLYKEIKSDLKNPPIVTKETENAKPGWVYQFNNEGRIFLYQNKIDNKYYVAFNKEGEEFVNKYDLIKKYNLEKAEEAQPESPE